MANHRGRWLLIDGETLEVAGDPLSGDDLTSVWIPVDSLDSAELECLCVSDTGTPTAAIVLHWSGQDKYELDNKTPTDNDYEDTELAAEGALTLDEKVTITNAVFSRPMQSLRVFIDVDQTTAQKSTLYVWLNVIEEI